MGRSPFSEASGTATETSRKRVLRSRPDAAAHIPPDVAPVGRPRNHSQTRSFSITDLGSVTPLVLSEMQGSQSQSSMSRSRLSGNSPNLPFQTTSSSGLLDSFKGGPSTVPEVLVVGGLNMDLKVRSSRTRRRDSRASASATRARQPARRAPTAMATATRLWFAITLVFTDVSVFGVRGGLREWVELS